MATCIQRANQYYEEAVVSTTDAAGTIGRIGFDFGFITSAVIFINDKADSVYVTLNSTVGSTGGVKLNTTEQLSFTAQTGGAALASTTTSTGTTVRVIAVGF
jgi:hypothetical protein